MDEANLSRHFFMKGIQNGIALFKCWAIIIKIELDQLFIYITILKATTDCAFIYFDSFYDEDWSCVVDLIECLISNGKKTDELKLAERLSLQINSFRVQTHWIYYGLTWWEKYGISNISI